MLEGSWLEKPAINLGPASWGFVNSMIAGKNKSPTDITDAIAKVTNKLSIICINFYWVWISNISNITISFS
ncbi:MAG: hypothetical protein ACM3UL_01085, partial [Ignavibacteria bacterium]